MPDTTPSPVCDVAMIGLGVMGQNLALNMADHGCRVAVYNRNTAITDKFILDNRAHFSDETGGGLVPATDLRALAALLKRPRRIVLLIKAGRPVDSVIESLVPYLDPGDLIVDGGNSEWQDTERREAALKDKGILFVGSGVSGGEEGARFGPSLMPGGSPQAWELLKPIWLDIAAKVDPATGKPIGGAAPGRPVVGGEPCAAYIGPGGSGHFVKMVHNGIEYGDMQLICEAYHLLRDVVGLDAGEMSAIFKTWNAGDLDSFLIEITADILAQQDPVTGKPFVEVVLDVAGQKGTGKWTVDAALQHGVPAPTIAEAVWARMLSALKDERVRAAEALPGPTPRPIAAADREPMIAAIRDALYCSKICSYAQGFALMGRASKEAGWGLDFGTIASIWRGGCIIRARFLQKITDAYRRDPNLPNLLLDPYFAQAVRDLQPGWRTVVAEASRAGVPIPAFASALSYYDAYRSARLPANLLQAQRDYFGAHTYERTDAPRGAFFHLDWLHPERPQSSAQTE